MVASCVIAFPLYARRPGEGDPGKPVSQDGRSDRQWRRLARMPQASGMPAAGGATVVTQRRDADHTQVMVTAVTLSDDSNHIESRGEMVALP